MRTARLGRTDAQVPVVSLGTWAYGGPNKTGKTSVGWSGHDDGLARDALRRAWEGGITHWDTADVYGSGRSEELIGGIWGDVPREAVFLASKVGWDKGPHGHWYHPEWIRSQLEKSLRQLKTETIDLYYLHHCDFGPEGEFRDDAVAVLRAARDEGKIRFIGLSDWNSGKVVSHIEAVDPDVVQPYRNVLDDTYASSGLKAWVEEHDVGVCFFSPIRHGLLLGKYDAPVTFPDGDFRANVDGFKDADLLARMKTNRGKLEERFARLDQPVLNALLGALLADTPTGCVLLGQRNPEQVAAALAADSPLSDEDAAWVRELYAQPAA